MQFPSKLCWRENSEYLRDSLVRPLWTRGANNSFFSPTFLLVDSSNSLPCQIAILLLCYWKIVKLYNIGNLLEGEVMYNFPLSLDRPIWPVPIIQVEACLVWDNPIGGEEKLALSHGSIPCKWAVLQHRHPASVLVIPCVVQQLRVSRIWET